MGAHADVRDLLLAPELDEELTGLVAAGRARQETAAATVDSFAGAALVFIATGCVGLDSALQTLAREAGVSSAAPFRHFADKLGMTPRRFEKLLRIAERNSGES